MRYYSNISKTMTLQVAVDLDDTTLNVDDASGLPTNYPYNVAIDRNTSSVEIVAVTNRIGNALTVTRGQQDTAAQNHAVGAKVEHVWTALDGSEAQNHFVATTDTHGVGAGEIVGTTLVQTLTGKTMDGALNTFSNIPAGALGALNNMSIGQALANFATLTLGRNGAATAPVLDTQYVRINSAGRLDVANEPTTNIVQRWYASNFTTILATMDSTGRLSSIGLTTTGSIVATGQSVTCGAITAQAIGCTTVTASGLITMNGGGSVPLSKTLTVAGVLAITGGLTLSSTASATVDGNVTFSATSGVTFNNGFATAGSTSALFNGQITVVQNATFSGPTALNSSITRDGSTARLGVTTGSYAIAANQATVGAAGSVTQFTGSSQNITVPAGRTAVLKVWFQVAVSGGTAGGATNTIVPRIDGSAIGSQQYALNTAQASPLPVSGMVLTTLTAGTYALDLAYVNNSGTGTLTYLSGLVKYYFELSW